MSRRHTKVPEGALKGNIYLSKNFELDKDDDTKVFCKICKDNLYYENLFGHLEVHIGYQQSKEEKNEIIKGIDYLNSLKKNQRSSLRSSGSKIKNLQLSKDDSVQIKKKVTRKNKKLDEKNKEADTLSNSSDIRSESITEFPNIADENLEMHFRFEVTDFLLSNNLPFSLANKLSPFLRKLATNHTSAELSMFTINDKNVSKIAHECIGKTLKLKYQQNLAMTPYSISLDAGTAANNCEYVGINIRFLQQITKSEEVLLAPVTKTIALQKLGTSATGKAFFDLL